MPNTTHNSIIGTHAAKASVAFYRAAGHEDARNGRGYRAEYETWGEGAQRAYENGRMVAVNVATAGFKLPVWHPGVTRPRGLPEMTKLAAARIGVAIAGRGRRQEVA